MKVLYIFYAILSRSAIVPAYSGFCTAWITKEQEAMCFLPIKAILLCCVLLPKCNCFFHPTIGFRPFGKAKSVLAADKVSRDVRYTGIFQRRLHQVCMNGYRFILHKDPVICGRISGIHIFIST